MSVVKSRRLQKQLEELRLRADQDHLKQEQSILFQVPAEIRNTIFDLALTEYEDMSRAYDRDTYYCRPGFRAPRTMAVALLRTCKRIWLETSAIPFKSLSTNQMPFAIGWPERRPPETEGNTPFQVPRSRKLLKHHWDALDSIQFFLQGATEENFEGFFHGGASQLEKEIAILPSTLIITTRYSDWLWWEESRPLFIDVATIRLPSSVTRLVMELEVTAAREGELNDLINDVFTHEDAYRWYCKDGEHLRVAHLEDPWKYVTTWKWDGPTKFNGQSFDHHPDSDTMPMVVKSLEWKRHEEAWDPTKGS